MKKDSTRKISLKRETMRQLTDAQVEAVGGGASPGCTGSNSFCGTSCSCPNGCYHRTMVM